MSHIPSDEPIEINFADLEAAIAAAPPGSYVSLAYRYPGMPTTGIGTRTIRDLMLLRSLADIDERRRQLCQLLWQRDAALPHGVDTVANASGAALTAGASEVWTFAEPWSHNSYAWFYDAIGTRSGWLLIMHGGHALQGPDHADIAPMIADARAAGHDVIAFSMPGQGPNSTAGNGTLRDGHDNLYAMETARLAGTPQNGLPFSGLRVFIAPVIRALNVLASEYDRVAMVGLSGGGFTTHFCAALDERIDASYPVAGSIPSFMRVVPAPMTSFGDAEQLCRTHIEILNYEEMFVAACSRGRKQLQILNDDDDCCFALDGAEWSDAIAYEAQAVAEGTWSFHSDLTSTRHEITAAARAMILADMEAIAAPVFTVRDGLVLSSVTEQATLVTFEAPAVEVVEESFVGVSGYSSGHSFVSADNTGVVGASPMSVSVGVVPNSLPVAQRILAAHGSGSNPTKGWGFYVNSSAVLRFFAFDGAGTFRETSGYQLVSGDLAKVSLFSGVHTGTVIRLFKGDVQIGSDVACVGYATPAVSIATAIGSSSVPSQWATEFTLIGLVAAEGTALSQAQLTTWKAACIAANDLAAYPTGTTHRYRKNVDAATPWQNELALSEGLDELYRYGSLTAVEFIPVWA